MVVLMVMDHHNYFIITKQIWFWNLPGYWNLTNVGLEYAHYHSRSLWLWAFCFSLDFRVCFDSKLHLQLLCYSPTVYYSYVFNQIDPNHNGQKGILFLILADFWYSKMSACDLMTKISVNCSAEFFYTLSNSYMLMKNLDCIDGKIM